MTRLFVAIVLALATAAPASRPSAVRLDHRSSARRRRRRGPWGIAQSAEPGTAQEFTTQTNEVGSYTFSNLPPGTYDLTITATGFRALTRRGVAITVNIVRREDVTLEVGQVTESVTVEAGQAALQTDKADVHAEFGSKELINMPLPSYRNYQSLINLVPGATPGQYQNSIQAAPARALVHQCERRQSQQ